MDKEKLWTALKTPAHIAQDCGTCKHFCENFKACVLPPAVSGECLLVFSDDRLNPNHKWAWNGIDVE